jgi:hypothetical protein
MRIRALPSLAAILLLVGCQDATLPSAAEPPSRPAATISHWPTWGTRGFYFLPWEPPVGETPGAFDATLSPVVRICRVTNEVCGPTLATFTKTSGSYGRLVTVDTQEESYDVSWPTGSTGAQTGQVYRVSVTVGTRELGFMDVLMVGSFWEFFATDTEVYHPWFAGWNLPISFRIDQDVPGTLNITPTSLTLNVGESRTVTSQLLDLRGQAITGELGWMLQTNTGAPEVAVLDSGWVVGTGAGTGTLWAWYGDLMTSIPVTVTDTRLAWSSVATGDPETTRELWGTGTSNVYAASHTGLLRYDGATWQHIEGARWRSLHDVSGTSSSNVWAVGADGIILRYNGTAWSGQRFDGTAVQAHPLTSFDAPARRITLRGLHAISATAAVAVGDSGTALFHNGTAWSVSNTGTTADLTDVWGTSLTNLYATTSTGRVMRYNGTVWSFVTGVQAPGALHAVWGSGTTNVYAVGDGGLVFRYNGSTWQRVRLPTRVPLYAVWGSSATTVYAAGAEGTIYRWNGTAWTPEKLASGQSQLFGVWGTGSVVYAARAGGLSRR